MSIELGIFIGVAAVALVLLIAALGFGLRRRRAFQTFADEIGAEFSRHDEFGLQSKLTPFDLKAETLVADSLKWNEDGAILFLFDLRSMESVKGGGASAFSTCCLKESGGSGDDLVVRSRFPLPDDVLEAENLEERPPDELFELFYEVETGAGLSVSQRRRLVEHVAEHDWFLEVRRHGGRCLVCSRGRALHSIEEWRALIEVAREFG